MQLSVFADLYEQSGPFATVYLQAGAPEQDAEKQVELRWRELAGELADAGVDDAVVEAIGERVERDAPGSVVASGLAVVANAGGVVSVHSLAGPVGGDQARWAKLPDLGPLVRSNASTRRQVIAVVDRAGADLRVRDVGRTSPSHAVEGADHPLHKVRGGGWSHKRMQNHVDEVVDRNAALVAEEIERMVADVRPSVIVLAGEVDARERVHHRLPDVLQPLVSVTDHGGRGHDDDEHLEAAVEAAAAESERKARAELLGRLGSDLGTGTAVQGLAAVRNALRQGAVDTLLFNLDNVDAGTPVAALRSVVAVGPEPLAFGSSEEELRKELAGEESGAALEVPELWSDLADAALVRAGAATSARAEVVSVDEAELTDGVAAVLRFAVPEGG